jgi:ankyrin repeat protein
MAASGRPVSQQEYLEAALNGDASTVRKYIIQTNKQKIAEFPDQSVASFDAKLGYSKWDQWREDFLPRMTSAFNAATDQEETALHLAAKTGQIKVVQTLFELEAALIHRNIMQQETAHHLMFRQIDVNQATPLLVAAANGHLEIVKAIFTYAAGLYSPMASQKHFFRKNILEYASLKNNDGEHAALAAINAGHPEIAKYIEETIGHKLVSQKLYDNPPPKKKKDPLQEHGIFKVAQNLPQREEKQDDQNKVIAKLTNEVAAMKNEMEAMKKQAEFMGGQLAVLMEKMGFTQQPPAYGEQPEQAEQPPVYVATKQPSIDDEKHVSTAPGGSGFRFR